MKEMNNEKYSEHCNARLLQIDSSSKLLFLLSFPLQRLAEITILQPLLAQGLCLLFKCIHKLTCSDAVCFLRLLQAST